ncbi:MAG: hypothetical protein AMS27_12670 [Bacteroides sp. SM23_62_1]|nr:MAG: hypothetical protein AMS27_12670 [Bacteroides sp. SM23_62_1]
MKNLSKICIISSFILHLLPSVESIGLRAQSIQYEVGQIPFTGELAGFEGTCILQDNDGFMWFVSYGGLYRYDGAGFCNGLNI